MHRAQLFIYLACSEHDLADGSEDVAQIREYFDNAQYWTDKVEGIMVIAGLRDQRVNVLRGKIDSMRRVVGSKRS